MNTRSLLAGPFLAFALLSACGSEPEIELPPVESRGHALDSTLPYVTGPLDVLTRELQSFGRGVDGAVQVHDIVWQTRGTANAQMVATPDGNVLIDTGLLPDGRAFAKQLRSANDARFTHVIASHSHADHYSGAIWFADDDTEIIVHPEFLHNQQYLKRLAPFLMPRNRIFFPHDVPPVPEFADAAYEYVYPTIEATRVVADRYSFEQGGVRFEVIAMPGAEGSDGLCVWLPDHGILFTGDLFGHIFPMWPNLVTIRGERARFVQPYLDSLQLVLELEPELIVPSHFFPVKGKAYIREQVQKTHDAVKYVHDAVIDGMNEGLDVYTLMREITLPPELQIPEVHGKVSWGVRSIWEAYSGWFELRSTTELYDVPVWDMYAEVAELAGGPDVLAGRAHRHIEAGRPEKALHLTEMALAADPEHRPALEVRLAALELLYERSGAVNHYEAYWLQHRIHQTRASLGLGDGNLARQAR